MARQRGEFKLSLWLVQSRDREQRQESLRVQEFQWRTEFSAGGWSSVGKDPWQRDVCSRQQQGFQTDSRTSF